MTNEAMIFAINIALVLMVLLVPLAFLRVLRGEGTADRLLGVESITTLIIGIVVLLAVVEETSTTIDIGIVLAAVSFAGTMGIARYISEGRVF